MTDREDAHLTDDPPHVRRRLVISGLVQGVGFRVSLADEATRAGVVGEVRNLNDGRVEAFLQGPWRAVEEVQKWCHLGPELARVRSIEATDESPVAQLTFVISE
jgi:acylphosphatase